MPKHIAGCGLHLLFTLACLQAPSALAQGVTLSHSLVTVKTANLTISGHTAAWWYKGDQSGAQCTAVATSTATANVTGLTGGTTYIYKAYSAAGCNATNLIATAAAFTTMAVTVDMITSTTARLNIANNTSRDWSYKQTSPSGPACQQDTPWGFNYATTSDSLSGLQPNSPYTFTVYFGASCPQTDVADSVSFTTSAADLAVSNVTKTTATLGISGHSNVAWWYQGSQSGATCVAVAANTVSANLIGLTVGAEYTYKAYSASGCAAANEIGSITFSTEAGAPGAPSNLKTTKTWRAASLPPNTVQYPSAVEVKFSWTSGADNGATITGTDLRYRTTSPTGSWETFTSAKRTELTLTFPSTGSAYYGKAMEFQVQDDNAKGDGAWSASSAFTVALAPAKPAAPSVTSGYKQLSLSWTAPDSRGADITGYDVQYRLGSSGSWTDHAHTGTGTTADITGLKHVAAYEARVRATNSQGDGAWSDAASATTRSGKVSGLRAAAGSASLDLSWDAQAGASSYRVQWRTTTEGWNTGNRQTTSTTASTTLTGLVNDTDYLVRVAAVFTAGAAAWSDEAAGRPVALPSLLQVSGVTATGATLTMSNNPGANNWWLKGAGGGSYAFACTQVTSAGGYGLAGLSGNTSYVFESFNRAGCSAGKQATAYFTTPGTFSLAAHTVTKDSAVIEMHGHDGRADWSYRVEMVGLESGRSCYAVRRGSAVSFGPLLADTAYTAQAFRGLTCQAVERMASVTFTTRADDTGLPALSVTNVADTRATLALANHAGEWFHDLNRNAATCTRVAAGTSAAMLTGLDQNTNYTATAYSDPRCSAATESVAWESAATFTTTGPVSISVSGKTATGFTVTVAGYTAANGYPARWSLNVWRPKAGGGFEGSGCESFPRATTRANVTSLKAGKTYTVSVYRGSSCNLHSDVVSDTTATTSLTAGASANSASLTLHRHEGDWSYRGGAAAGEPGAGAQASAGDGATHQCRDVPAGAYTAQLDGLRADTAYAYTAYAGPACAGAELGQAAFTTPPPPPPAGPDTGKDGASTAIVDERSGTAPAKTNLTPAFAAGAAIADLSFEKGARIEPRVLPAADGTPLRYTFTPPLPAGISFNPATRTLSGAPTVAMAETAYTYTATYANGNTVSLRFTIAVEANLRPDFGAAAIDDRTYTQHSPIEPLALPEARGGNGELTYTLTPDLPAGLTFDAATRTLSGTPTAVVPATDYAYTATDRDGDTATLTFTIKIKEADTAPTFGDQRLPALRLTRGRVIEPRELPAATSGNGALTYALSPARLPAA